MDVRPFYRVMCFSHSYIFSQYFPLFGQSSYKPVSLILSPALLCSLLSLTLHSSL